MNIAESFKQHQEAGYFSRVNNTHPLDLYIGLDDQNHYALEFRGKFTPQLIKSSNAIGITQSKSENYNSLVFFLKEIEMFDNFCVFCEDIIRCTENTIDDKVGYKNISDRYYSWRKMFKTKSTTLLETNIMGLIGELLFLRDYMFEHFGQYDSLLAWSGQELTHKDFSLEKTWYEVKSISMGKELVRISSLEQLQSNNDGYLVVYQLEKMSPVYDGTTVRKLATEVLSILDSADLREMYINKLVESGFAFDPNYDNYVYEVSNPTMYQVTQEFPKLTSEDVPVAVTKAQYDILLSEIESFKI